MKKLRNSIRIVKKLEKKCSNVGYSSIKMSNIRPDVNKIAYSRLKCGQLQSCLTRNITLQEPGPLVYQGSQAW